MNENDTKMEELVEEIEALEEKREYLEGQMRDFEEKSEALEGKIRILEETIEENEGWRESLEGEVKNIGIALIGIIIYLFTNSVAISFFSIITLLIYEHYRKRKR